MYNFPHNLATVA